MRRKFLEGFVFGAGFSLALILVGLFAGSLFAPLGVRSREPVVTFDDAERGPGSPIELDEPQFHDLALEEQINKASVIALARYEPAADGQVKAILKEFLKKDRDTTIYYDVDDEYPSASHYPREGRNYGDGVVIFFVGSPAEMRMSMSYSGDRIHSLGDIPLELFRKKCEAGA